MVGAELLVILVLVLANGLFAGAEIALLGVRPGRVAERVRRGDRRAIAVAALRDKPERFLATVQIGITVVGAAAAAFGGASLVRDLTPLLEAAGIGGYANEIAFVLVIAFISWLSLVLGELVPKSLALRYSQSYAFAAARPLLLLSMLMRPLVWFLTACSNLVLRLFGDRTSFTEARLSRDELRELVGEATKTGAVDPRTGEIAARALAFDDVAVAEVMVPRDRVVALRRAASQVEVRRVILEEGHSRMPVYDGNLDHVIGYVVARDVLSMAWQQDLVVLEDIIRPAYSVGAATRAVDALREMQRRQVHMAVVTDVHGGLAGIVTIEDLIEELVGEIFSEDDRPVSLVMREPDGTALVPGWAPVRKVNRELDLDLPVGIDRTTTIAGLTMSMAQAIPQAGDRLVTEDETVLEIVEASPKRVRRVRIRPAS